MNLHDGKRRCGLSFPSARQLSLHKTQTGHKQNKRRKANTTTQNHSQPKQLRLEQCFAAAENAEADEPTEQEPNADDESENDEDVVACGICKFFSEYHILIFDYIIKHH